MNDVERRLRELGDRAREDVVEGLRPRAASVRRIARRRAGASAGVVLCAAVAVAGVAVAWPTGGEDRGLPPAATSSPSPDSFQEGGRGPVVWPEDTIAEAEEGCAAAGERTRTGPAVVGRFATEVLDWEAQRVVAPQKRSRPWTVKPFAGDTYGGEIEAGVRMWVTEVVPGCWAVAGVSRLADRRPTGVGISVAGEHVEVGFETFGAAEASVEVGYGRRSARRRHDARPRGLVRMRLGFEPRATGHFLILLRDEEGRVFSAVAAPLPAGDFSAG